MLLGDFALKFSSFIASFFELSSPPNCTHGMDSGSGLAYKPASDTSLMLSDVLTVQTSASIFYSYARDTLVGEMLTRDYARITVFAPTNKAVMALARKPHQGPTPVDDTVISEEELDNLSRENVERWISAHIVPQPITTLTPSSKYETLLEDVTITVDAKSGSKSESDKSDDSWRQVALNGNISIVGKTEAVNGVLYLLDGALYG